MGIRGCRLDRRRHDLPTHRRAHHPRWLPLVLPALYRGTRKTGFQRPAPAWAVDAMALHNPTGDVELNLSLPGNANRGNAAQALAAATVAGVPG